MRVTVKISVPWLRTPPLRLWRFRFVRRWWMRQFGVARLVAPKTASELMRRREVAERVRRYWERAAAEDAHDSRAIAELVESAARYCEHCPIQGTCAVCGAYHGSGAE